MTMATSALNIASQSNAPASLDLAALKARQQGAWSSGDYAVVGTTLQIVGETLCEALDLCSGSTVLDVAAGNGNASLAAARRWCDVTATDYVPALLERARERAQAERLPIAFREADAEALPFEDESFDAVVSTFGVMFTPDQDPGGLYRPGVQDDRAASSASTRHEVAGEVGHGSWDRRAVRASFGMDQVEPSPLRVPLPLARALPHDIQDLLRAGAQSFRGARARGTVRPRARPPDPNA
jgi:SAM-dependent methyltransferase